MRRKLIFLSVLFILLGSSAAFPIDIFGKVGTNLSLNTLDKKNSAPSPVSLMGGIGVKIPDASFVSAQPSLEYFHTYNLFYKDKALPAEIENRTASTHNILLTVPVLVTLDFEGHLYSSKAEFGGGPAFLFRFSGLANGVSENDSGYSGTAKKDIDAINSYFWEKARFLYLNLQGAWLMNYGDRSFGPQISAYLPIGGLIAKEGVNGMMINVAIKVVF